MEFISVIFPLFKNKAYNSNKSMYFRGEGSLMSKKYEVHYSLRGSITIKAKNEEEAKQKLLSSDYTETRELFNGVEANMADSGNDAIGIDDVYETVSDAKFEENNR